MQIRLFFMDWQKIWRRDSSLGLALCPIVYAHLCMVCNRLLLDLSFSEQTSACEAKNDVIFMFKTMSHQTLMVFSCVLFLKLWLSFTTSSSRRVQSNFHWHHIWSEWTLTSPHINYLRKCPNSNGQYNLKESLNIYRSTHLKGIISIYYYYWIGLL